MTGRRRPVVGDRVTLACSCQAEVAVQMVVFLPRHAVVRILSGDPSCRKVSHARGRRVLVRWREDGSRRLTFADTSTRWDR
jgi:hypothetical protein